MYLILNGQVISDETPCINANDRGFLYGDGIFETFKAINGKLVHFKEHYQRFKHSADTLGLLLTENCEQLQEHCKNLLKINKLSVGIAGLRMTLTRGPADRGITLPKESCPTLLINAFSYSSPKEYFPKALITNVRRNEYSQLTQHKTLQCAELIWAKHLAHQAHFDEAILLNTQGLITETGIGNLFFVIDGTVYTPRIADGILPGIVRALVIDACRELEIPVHEQALKPTDIQKATEAFQTNSLIDVQAFSFINDYPLNFGAEGHYFEVIKKQYLSMG